MVALGSDLYVYGGTREMQDGEDNILSDILVARARDGVVNQTWKRLAISKRAPPHGVVLAPEKSSPEQRSCMAWQHA